VSGVTTHLADLNAPAQVQSDDDGSEHDRQQKHHHERKFNELGSALA
jgi:hypothetical protein